MSSSTASSSSAPADAGGRRDLPRTLSHLLPSAAASAVNPFVNHSVRDMPPATRLRFLAGFLFLLPIRLFALVIILVAFFSLNAVATHNLTAEERKKPFVPWRRFLMRGAQFMMPPLLMCFGFMSIRKRGVQAEKKDAPLLVVAPHSNPLDWAPVEFFAWASVVSDKSNLKIPVIGTALRSLQCILVDRFDPNSKKMTVGAIKDRVAAVQAGEDWPPLMIFPGGCTTRNDSLITFKPGAFIPGAPVQPVALNFTPDGFDASWVADGPSLPVIMLLCMAQCWGTIDITFLPVHVPTEEEKASPMKFADAVRAEIAAVLRVPMTEHATEDMILQAAARKRGLPASVGTVEYSYLKRKLGVSLDDTKKYLDDFAKMDKNHDGKVSLEEFAAYLNLPATSDSAKSLFAGYASSDGNELQFKEYIAGMVLVTTPVLDEALLLRAFTLLEQAERDVLAGTSGTPEPGAPLEANAAEAAAQAAIKAVSQPVIENGDVEEPTAEKTQHIKVSSAAFKSMLESMLLRQGLSVEEAADASQKVLFEADLDKDGFVTFDEFVSSIKAKPLYANLLATSLKEVNDVDAMF